MDVTRSSVPFVKRYVLSPFSALWMGPRIERVPIQNKRIAVESPCPSPLFPVRSVSFWNFPSISSQLPIRLPTARLTMNNTGYLLPGILETMELIPIPAAASPMASNNTFCCFSPILFRNRLPAALPIKMVDVL